MVNDPLTRRQHSIPHLQCLLWTLLPAQGLCILHAGHLHLQPAAVPGFLHHHEGEHEGGAGSAGSLPTAGAAASVVCLPLPAAPQLGEDPPVTTLLHRGHRGGVGCGPVLFLSEPQQLGGKRPLLLSGQFSLPPLHSLLLIFPPSFKFTASFGREKASGVWSARPG